MKKQEVKVGDRLKVYKKNKWVEGNVTAILGDLAHLGHGDHSVYVDGREEFEVLGNHYLKAGSYFCVPKEEYAKMSHEETRGFIPDYPYVVVKPLTYTAWFRKGVAAIGYDEYVKAGESIEPFRGSKTHQLHASDDTFSFHGALVHHTKEISKEEAELMLKRFKKSESKRRKYVTTEELIERVSENTEIKNLDFALVNWHKFGSWLLKKNDHKLEKVRFVNCSFRGATISFSVEDVDLIGCDMRGIQFYDDIRHDKINCHNLKVKYCNFSDAYFRLVNFVEGVFKDNNFTNSTWESVELKDLHRRSYFRNCDFSGVQWLVVDSHFGFIQSDLSKAANLSFVDFGAYEGIDKRVITLKGICNDKSCKNLYYFLGSQRWVAGCFSGSLDNLNRVLAEGVDADNVAQFLINHPYNKEAK